LGYCILLLSYLFNIIYSHGIKKSDIERFWKTVEVGGTCAVYEGETYVYIHDWERFCYFCYGDYTSDGELTTSGNTTSIDDMSIDY